jgi:flagellar protein FliS
MSRTPLELVRILYRAALESVGAARRCLRANQVKERSRQITKASEIINELTLSLDRERGGDIAKNLVELYDYIQSLLLDANFRQIEAPLEQVEGLLRTLLEAWEKCAPQPSASRPSDLDNHVVLGNETGAHSRVSVSY